MRSTASILHLDLDAFFAAVEQRDKPSLRGKPVVVGGLGSRGVVSTAFYEARSFGVHSAMPTHEARKLCPHAAFLVGRFAAYRAGGLTASVGIATSKFMAKVASELAKPDGVRVVEPGAEPDLIADLPARIIPGVGPATMERLARLGVRTVADIRALSHAEVVRELGRASGEWVYALSFARDDRPVVAEREAKSISVEDTFATDIADRSELEALIERDARIVAARLSGHGLFARTVTIKAKRPDFTTISRSLTLHGATDRLRGPVTHRHRRIHTNSPIQPDTERKPAMSLPISPTWGQPAPEWLSLQQAAGMYGASVDTLRRRIASGKLRASRFGVRLIRVRVEDLDRLFRPIPMGDDLTQRRARARNQRSW